MSFLPNNYERPATKGGYMKLEKGDNKLRVLNAAITGFVVWASNPEKKMDRFPFRFKEFKDIDPEVLARRKPSKEGKIKEPQHFWNMKVYDYKSKSVKVWEVTQKSIQEAVIGMNASEEYGDPTGYDISISRTGEGLETKYTLLPSPPKEVSEDVAKADSDTPVNLEALFDGGDPYAVIESKKKPENKQVEEPVYESDIKPEDLPF